MKKLFKYRLFWAGLILKISSLPFFGSYYTKDLFIPFLDQAILHPGSNPWSLSPPHFFPYGSVIFTFLYIPRLIAYILFDTHALGLTPLSMILIKLPLLGFDLFFLNLFCKVAPQSPQRVLKYYWLNPVLFFISYIHVQLDIAAIAFCFLALISISPSNPYRSAIYMALATLCKFHVVIVIPLLLAYTWNNNFLQSAVERIFRWLAIWAGICTVGFLPVMMAKQISYVTTSSPQALRILGFQLPYGDGHTLFLGIAIVMLVLGRLCVSTRITNKGLIYSAGIAFGALILVTRSAPGWYFWVVPFAALFYVEYFTNHAILFWAFCCVYLFHFSLFDEIPGQTNLLSSDIPFTAVQVFLFGIFVEIWTLVLNREMPLLGRIKPFLIGIAGDSGVGKDTLTNDLSLLLGPKNTVVVEGDDYHRWERSQDPWKIYTHLDPKANFLPVLSNHMSALTKGQFIFQPHYDHTTGRFTDPREIKPNKTMIAQGLHTFYLRNMRRRLDLKIFLAPERSIQLFWKLNRDIKDRGHSPEKILTDFAARDKDFEAHIKPQRDFADWIIEVFSTEKISEKEILSGRTPTLSMRHIFWNDAPIQGVVESLQEKAGCEVTIAPVPNDLNRISVQIIGNPTVKQIETVAKDLFPNIRQITRSRHSPHWKENLHGISQLLAIALIQEYLD